MKREVVETLNYKPCILYYNLVKNMLEQKLLSLLVNGCKLRNLEKAGQWTQVLWEDKHAASHYLLLDKNKY